MECVLFIPIEFACCFKIYHIKTVTQSRLNESESDIDNFGYHTSGSGSQLIHLLFTLLVVNKTSLRSPSLLFSSGVLDDGFSFLFLQLKNLDGSAFQWHVRCATEFKKCYIIWRSPTNGVLALCHPDTIKVIQSSNAPKAYTYRFSKPFFGESWFFPGMFLA